jgi:subtilisin family serine protease
MNSLELVRLPTLMERTEGSPEIIIGLIDGPVAIDHPNLSSNNIREIPGKLRGACTLTNSFACMHGTFVAGILSAKRGSDAPAICPNCTLLVRPIFTETSSGNWQMPSATPKELALAIADCIDAGAYLLNLSVALIQSSTQAERELQEVLDYAARRGVILVAAAGNQGTLGSTTITRHPWVIPVVAYDLHGRPIGQSNMGASIGRRGLGAPGEAITSLGTNGQSLTFSGTSAAAPFVTGIIALLWSDTPSVSAAEVKFAVAQSSSQKRKTVIPPLADAWAAHQALIKVHAKR